MASKKEKCYIFWLVFFVLASIGLLAGLLYTVLEGKKKSTADEGDPDQKVKSLDEETCLTKDCTLTASMLIAAMDTSLDPCDNFYEFACANFIRNNPVPVGKDYSSAAWNFNKNFQLQLKNLVEGMGSLTGPKVMYRLQEAYHVCINTTYQRDKEFNAFRNFTRNVLDWPLAIGTHWRRKHPTLTDYMAKYEEIGLPNVFTQIHVDLEPEDTLSYRVLITPQWRESALLTHTGNPDEEDDEEQKLAIMFKRNETTLMMRLIKEIAHLIGNNDDRSIDHDLLQIREMVDKINEYSNKLREDSDNNDSNSDDDNETTEEPANATTDSLPGLIKVTFLELQELTGNNINWLHVVNKKMRNKHVFKATDNVTIIDKSMFDIIKYITSETHIRVFANVMAWETLFPNILREAGPAVEELMTKYYTDRSELLKSIDNDDDDNNEEEEEGKEKPARWEVCLRSVHKAFMLAITRMFLEKYVDRSEKQSAEEMIQLIQEAYKQNIRDSNWLDENTKNNAINKADGIQRYVGYPDFIFNDTALDEAYEDVLPEVKSTHFENFIQINADSTYEMIPNLGDDPEVEEWDLSPLIVNAFYKPNKNSIWFPSAILQLPFFKDTRLSAINFGMIGAVIGHEIGHAFDDSGSTYDERGNPKNWWSNHTREIFEQKGQCFVDQYNNFCPEYLQGGENDTSICVNGQGTLGENLADSTGLIASFMAYKLWVEKHGTEKRLPGLNEYTPEQLFFISNAYVWCENIPADKWVDLYTYDPHAPGMYRVLGTASNSRFFREAFHCDAGPMNRDKDSCIVW